MRAQSILTALLGLVALAAVPLAAGKAQEAISIAAVDLNRVERSSQAWASLQDQLNTRREAFQEEMRAIERQIEQARADLEGRRAIVSQEAFQQELQSFQGRMQQARQSAAERQRDLQQSYETARQEIRKVISEILVEVAQENGYELILNIGGADGSVLFATGSLIVTDEVLARLDQRLTGVTLPAAQ